MCQCHSLPASEPASYAVSLLLGLVAYGLMILFTVSHETAMTLAAIVAVVSNVLVGGCINLAMMDLLGSLLARPISGFLVVKLLASIVAACR